jgi:molybdopterin-binding protein
LKIGARNRFRGGVVAITPGALNIVVKMDIGAINGVTSVVIAQAVSEPWLAVVRPNPIGVRPSRRRRCGARRLPKLGCDPVDRAPRTGQAHPRRDTRTAPRI